MTKAEKEAAKAAKQAERDAAKADVPAVGVTLDASWTKIQSQHVFIKEPQTAKAMRTANILANQPFVPLTIFPTIDNPDEQLYWGGINGFFFSIVVGVEVSVPRGIAEHVTKGRLANNKITRSLQVVNPFTGKPVEVNLDAASAETRARLGL